MGDCCRARLFKNAGANEKLFQRRRQQHGSNNFLFYQKVRRCWWKRLDCCYFWIVQHHCVTKIGFDVSYGYLCSYSYSAATAIFDKRRINKFINPPPAPVPSKNYSNEGTAAGSNNFVSCWTGFTEEEDADKNGWIATSLCDQDWLRRDLWLHLQLRLQCHSLQQYSTIEVKNK